MSDSGSNSISFSSDSGSDSADEGTQCQPVAPPSSGASIEHYQQYIKYLQLQQGQLQQRNASLNESNGILAAQQLKRSRKRPQTLSSRVSSMSQTASAILSASESAVSAPASSTTNDVDKLILSLAKKYALTTEMFLPDKVIFQTDCPDPAVDFSNPNRYAKKSTAKDALVAELYASIDHTLHAQMRTNAFFNQFGSGMQQARSSFLNSLRTVAGGIFNMPNEFFISKYDRTSLSQVTDLIGWEAGKGKAYDIFKAPILYPDHIVNEKKIFRNWIVIAKVAVCGKMSLYSKARGGPPSYAKMWKLTSCTPGLIAFSVTSTRNSRTVKKFFVVKWNHQRIKSVVEQINGYVFDGTVKTQPSNDTQCTMEQVTESLDRVMAALDASDSDSNDDSDSLEYVNLPVQAANIHPTVTAAAAATISTLQPKTAVDAPQLEAAVRNQSRSPATQSRSPAPTTFHFNSVFFNSYGTMCRDFGGCPGSERGRITAIGLVTIAKPQAKASRGRRKPKSQTLASDSTTIRRSSRHAVA
ncbi:uncharacterized protein HD556DRAFT_1451951 [Suillus plorans]|uniref:Uncharacterized protein n=1 Tax=Suillus plorans TaxID=116603 RepID=A0A9P7D9T1_9AGAM|nr:uncharacterized protein HD556DRAFT_1451951 [Suillus plorans]KAG1784292.1 hypothetical protein HD556DRAFT_1451951 [Suillus plorans]